MMSWNYRVIKHVEDSGVEWYGMHEVYYGDNGAPRYCTMDAVSPYGGDLKDLATDLGMMIRALGEDVLPYDLLSGDDELTEEEETVIEFDEDEG